MLLTERETPCNSQETYLKPRRNNRAEQGLKAATEHAPNAFAYKKDAAFRGARSAKSKGAIGP